MCVHTLTPRENRERPESGIFKNIRKKNTIFNEHPVEVKKAEWDSFASAISLDELYLNLPPQAYCYLITHKKKSKENYVKLELMFVQCISYSLTIRNKLLKGDYGTPCTT